MKGMIFINREEIIKHRKALFEKEKVFDKDYNKEYISDFYIPSLKLYIEIWGYTTPEYQKHTTEKIAVYMKKGEKLLSLYENDIRLLDDTLSKHLL